ncbi:MAG: mannose-1-phosphate guanylyltransferase [Microscillaceae bacterium]|nr:mannose-1-phosphate guanylyltransferase [Microscillaceae bacterium]
MNHNNYAVIMAGGVGTRLWPFSRTNYPKQFHDILGTGKTLLQQTVHRFREICPIENVYIVTNQIYYDLVKEQLPELMDDQILLEPVKRNTAPCIAYACYKIGRKNPQANLVVAPADQVILQEDQFRDALLTALKATESQDILVTLGIKPTRPDTGYGYIQFFENDDQVVKKVKTFTEKPDLEYALKFLESGDYVWNAGIFIWNAQAIMKAFNQYMPDLGEIFDEAQPAFYTENEAESIKKAYSLCKSDSIDIGVMEKADNVYVILCSFDWSDLGTWKSLFENSVKTPEHNVVTGNVMTYDTENCIIKTPEDKLVVVQGLENFIIAEFDGVLLICNKDQEQRVKDFVADAKNKGNHFV